MIKNILSFLFLMLVFCFAQGQDYLIFQNGDTLFGKFMSGQNATKYIHFRTEEGKIKIPAAQVKEFNWEKRKYWILQDPCEKGLSSYLVLIEGTASLLHSGGREDYCPDIIMIDNIVYPIKRSDHFSEDVWKVLSTCSHFNDKYNAYYLERRKQTIVWEWTYRKSRTKWMEMIRLYNSNCGQSTYIEK